MVILIGKKKKKMLKPKIERVILDNTEWQVLREALEEWRNLHLKDIPLKKSSSYTLEEKIEKMYAQNLKEHKI